MASSGAGLTPFGNALSGALGGVISNAIVYPLDTVKTRLQAEAKSAAESAPPLPSPQIKRENAPSRLPPRKLGSRHMIKRILKENGVEGFYRGFLASMLNTFSMQFAYFYWYSIVRRTYVERIHKSTAKMGTATELVLGAIAGAIAQIFTIPVSVVATRQQLDERQSGTKSLVGTATEIVSEDGLTGLWRGLRPSLVLTVNPAITYGMFERLKTAILGEDGKMTPGKAFYIGALSKTLATVVTYPYIMSRVRLQARYNDEQIEGAPPKQPQAKKDRYKGALDVLAKVYREKGFAGWYQGMQAQITKAVLAQSLLFVFKDIIEGFTLRLLLAISRRQGKAIGVAGPAV